MVVYENESQMLLGLPVDDDDDDDKRERKNAERSEPKSCISIPFGSKFLKISFGFIGASGQAKICGGHLEAFMERDHGGYIASSHQSFFLLVVLVHNTHIFKRKESLSLPPFLAFSRRAHLEHFLSTKPRFSNQTLTVTPFLLATLNNATC